MAGVLLIASRLAVVSAYRLREYWEPFVENVTPGKYRLFQAADMIATLELLRAKLRADGRITASEKGFFESVQKLNRTFLKPLSRKMWN